MDPVRPRCSPGRGIGSAPYLCIATLPLFPEQINNWTPTQAQEGTNVPLGSPPMRIACSLVVLGGRPVKHLSSPIPCKWLRCPLSLGTGEGQHPHFAIWVSQGTGSYAKFFLDGAKYYFVSVT